MQAPFAIPVRTGVVLMDGVAESSGLAEVMSFLMHAEVCLRLRLPTGRVFRLAWYQGIEGFTGWHAGASPLALSASQMQCIPSNHRRCDEWVQTGGSKPCELECCAVSVELRHKAPPLPRQKPPRCTLGSSTCA